MTTTYEWTITPTGVVCADGTRVVTRLLYNLTASDSQGANGDLGAPGIVYLSKPVPADGVTPTQLAGLLRGCLGGDTVAMFKRIAEKNLASFEGDVITVAG